MKNIELVSIAQTFAAECYGGVWHVVTINHNPEQLSTKFGLIQDGTDKEAQIWVDSETGEIEQEVLD